MNAVHKVVHDTFVVERHYSASPAKVFGYFAEAERRKRWFAAAEDWTYTAYSLDFKIGGTETDQGRPPRGPLIVFDGRFLDIVPEQRIINSYVLTADGVPFSVSLCTVEFVPKDGGTFLRLTEHGAYFDGNDKAADLRRHGVAAQYYLLGRKLEEDQR